MDKDKMERLEGQLCQCVLENNQELFTALCDEREQSITMEQILKIWNGAEKFSSLNDSQLYSVYKVFLKYYPDRFESSESYFDLDSGRNAENKQPRFVNPERKTRYHQALKDSGKMCRFSGVRQAGTKIEEFFGKDLCELSCDEAISGLTHCEFLTAQMVRTNLDAIRAYIKWCRKEGIIGKEKTAFEKIKVDDIPLENAMSVNIIGNQDKLKEILETVTALDSGHIIIPAACLSWEGLSSKEYLELLDDNVDLVNGIIKVGKEEITIVGTILEMLRYYKAACTGDVVITRGAMSAVYRKAEMDTFIKRTVVATGSKMADVPIKPIEISNFMHKASLKYTDITKERRQITDNNIRLFGRLYRLEQTELEQGKVSDDDFIREFKLPLSKTNLATDIKDYKRLYQAYRTVKNARST